MKAIPLVIAALGLIAGFLIPAPPQVVILSGDTQGYLSPCGCSSPMMGGIRRRASAIRLLSEPGHTTVLENGGFVDKPGRQSEMKAEAIVQAMAAIGVAAINIGPGDTAMGRGEVLQLSQLADDRLISLQAPDLPPTKVSGPFLIGGASDAPQAFAAPLGAAPIALDAAVQKLVDEAQAQGLIPILMLQGGHEAAVKLAQKHPALVLIQYSSVGNPPARLERIGRTALATPGEHGKHLIRVVYQSGRFEKYQSVALGPQFKDDPAIARFYDAYLRGVDREALLDKLPRKATAGYAGSWACSSCHPSAMRTWKQSGHRHAYETIAARGHGRDPDCVGCHSVGLGSTGGFRSRAATPQFANVGCESCHGPGLSHARRPREARLARPTRQACVSCHNPENSPNFDFETYWPKIAHR